MSLGVACIGSSLFAWVVRAWYRNVIISMGFQSILGWLGWVGWLGWMAGWAGLVGSLAEVEVVIIGMGFKSLA